MRNRYYGVWNDGPYYFGGPGMAQQNFANVDLQAQNAVRQFNGTEIIFEMVGDKSEPVAIWSRHADH